MILAWQVARGVVWLKRTCAAAESIAGSLEELVKIERERTPARRTIRKAEITVADPMEWNQSWREAHPQLDAEEGEL